MRNMGFTDTESCIQATWSQMWVQQCLFNSYQLLSTRRVRSYRKLFLILHTHRKSTSASPKGVFFGGENDVTMWRIKALHNCDGNMNKAVELLMEKAER